MSEIVRSAMAARLRALTPARVGLGRTGASQQTRDVLAFQLCHAQARDAVHAALDAAALAAALEPVAGPVLRLRSNVGEGPGDRAVYLQRPDLGRRLDGASRQKMAALPQRGFDLVVVVTGGLSALAVERHAQPLMEEVLARLEGWRLAPVCVVEQGRVAIGDEIGEALGAEMAVVLIGERPGLSSPDSLGAYITWMPRPGRTDAERVCISNIRSEGLSYKEAADQLERTVKNARARRFTGVASPDRAVAGTQAGAQGRIPGRTPAGGSERETER
jgi:ethanolamine ammonia-lyase small subunit